MGSVPDLRAYHIHHDQHARPSKTSTNFGPKGWEVHPTPFLEVHALIRSHIFDVAALRVKHDPVACTDHLLDAEEALLD